MEANQEADILNSFPDEILINIISFLLLNQAAQTCVLSRRWRNLFTFVSNLNLDDTDFAKKRYEMNHFMNFVDQFLDCHVGNIVDKFFIKCGGKGSLDSNRVDKWINYALHKKVRELDLGSFYYNIARSGMSHCGVFACNTLEVLRLSNNFVLKLPLENICLPNLKFLKLRNMRFSDEDSLQRLIYSCSVLEELVILGCNIEKKCKFNVFNPTLKRLTIRHSWGFDEVGIDAPSLVYFNYSSSPPELLLLKNLNSLVNAHIDFTFSPPYNSHVLDLFEAVRHIQSLELSALVAKVILKHIACNAFPSPPWSQLKTLRIFGFGDRKYELQMVEYFLKKARALEKFSIQILISKSKRVDIEAEYWRSKITSCKGLQNLGDIFYLLIKDSHFVI